MDIKQRNDTKFCKTRDAFLNFKNHLEHPKKGHPPPCLGIRSMYEWHGEVNNSCAKTGFAKDDKLVIDIQFTDDFYKEISYIRAYPVESLVGNNGGYIGQYISKL